MPEADIVPIRKRPPVLTATYSEDAREPLGSVACDADWNLQFPAAFENLKEKLVEKALLLYPGARVLTNFTMTDGAGYHGHSWYVGTADVYGEILPDGDE